MRIVILAKVDYRKLTISSKVEKLTHFAQAYRQTHREGSIR